MLLISLQFVHTLSLCQYAYKINYFFFKNKENWGKIIESSYNVNYVLDKFLTSSRLTAYKHLFIGSGLG